MPPLTCEVGGFFFRFERSMIQADGGGTRRRGTEEWIVGQDTAVPIDVGGSTLGA